MIRDLMNYQVKGLAEVQRDAGCYACRKCMLEMVGITDCCREGAYALPRFQTPGNIRCRNFESRPPMIDMRPRRKADYQGFQPAEVIRRANI